ncbi:uncharacterized protein LOC126830140 isoform X4 [Patella vulgata]|uniref:uncharacterized protein LOC126830140 isoform X4 n=1 Tax=Patella vulgata TaxID=6465 RepID=UPI0024A94AF8|nr:uncharacterized protein LOC126830140 isoform X4 [Patella vulgata]
MIKLFSVFLILFNQQIILNSVSGGLVLQGIGIPLENREFQLRCSKSSWFSFSLKKASFYRNDTEIATVERDGLLSWTACELISETELDYGCRATYYTKTLVIKMLNITRDSNTIWTCRNQGDRSNYHLLNVEEQPKDCDLNTMITHKYSENRNDQHKVLILTEGNDLELNCTSNTNYNDKEISYKWTIYREGEQSITTNKSLYLKNNITKDDGGMYECNGGIRNNTCVDNDVIEIQMNYAPRLNISLNSTEDRSEMTCIADGSPVNYTINNWRHYVDNQFIRELNGIQEEHLTTLLLDNITILDEGIYVCNISNGIKNLKGSVFQTAQEYLQIQAPPKSLEINNEITEKPQGSNIGLKATFLVNRSSSMNTTWYQVNTITKDKTLLPIETTYSTLTRTMRIYNNDIDRKVTVVSSSLTITAPIDELNFTVIVCNQYRCTESDQVIIIIFEDKENIYQYLPVIIGIVIVVVIIIIIIILIILRKRCNNVKKEDNVYVNQESIRQQTRENTMEILENDLYISADDDQQDNPTEIIENDLYVSGDDDPPKTINIQEMEIMENELYIPAELDTRI